MSKTLVLEQVKVNLEGVDLTIVHPQNDSTLWGTLAAIKEGTFKLDKVDFKTGDVFIDLGSNIGVLSCLVAKKHPGVKVYAFDASPIAILCLKMNCNLNSILNVTAFQKAIGANFEKNVKFYSNSKEVSTLVEEKLDTQNRTDFYECDKIKITDIFDSPFLGIDKVKYFKVDIEGTEFECFDYIYDQRKDVLDRIDYINLEIHSYPDKDYVGLGKKIKETFGERAL